MFGRTLFGKHLNLDYLGTQSGTSEKYHNWQKLIVEVPLSSNKKKIGTVRVGLA